MEILERIGGAGHYFLGGHSLLLIFCYQTHSLTVEEIKILGGARDNIALPLMLMLYCIQRSRDKDTVNTTSVEFVSFTLFFKLS